MTVAKWIEILQKEPQNHELMIEGPDGNYYTANEMKNRRNADNKNAVVIGSSDMV